MKRTFAIILVLVLILLKPDLLTLSQVISPLPADLVLVGDSVRVSENEYADVLFYVDASSLEMTTLLKDVGAIFRAFWSPDGQYIGILGASSSPHHPHQICIYTSAGQTIHCWEIEVFGKASGLPLVWGENNLILVLLESESELPQLGVINTQALSISRTLIISVNNIEGYSWSPTGRHLAYQIGSDDSTMPLKHLYVFDLIEMEATFITDTSYLGCLAWESTGEQLLVAQPEDKFTVYDMSGSVVSETFPRFKGVKVTGCPIAWSHDSAYLAFSSFVPEKDSYQLFVTSVDDGQAYLLEDNFYSSYDIVWSPDDTHIATEAVRGGGYSEVVVISLDGWEKWYRTNTGIVLHPVWRPLTSMKP